MQVGEDIGWRNFCPGSGDHARLRVVNVLPETWLDQHRDLIAAVAPPPLPFLCPSPNPDLPTAPPVPPPSPPPPHPRRSTPLSVNYGGVFPKHINMLPNEVMLAIFSYLSPADLELNVSRVCVRWRSLAEHASLRRRVSLSGGDGMTTPQALCMLRAAEKLVELSLDTRTDVVALIEAAVTSRCSLRKLIINRVFPTFDITVAEALRGLLLNSNLRELTISHCLSSMFLRPFFSLLKPRFVNLRKLNLNFVLDLCHDDLSRIVNCCPRLADLRLLTIRRHANALVCNDEDMTVIGLLSETLEVLNIDAADVTDVGIAILTFCHRMRIICLRDLPLVTDQGLQSLLFFRKLESLHLSGVNAVTKLGWTLLFRHPFWPRLWSVTLINCSLSDQGAAYLIPNYPRLSHLNILGCAELSTVMIKRLLTSLKRLVEIAVCLAQVQGCVYWIPACAPNIKKIIYHSCFYPKGPHLEMHEPYVARKDASIFHIPTRSIILSLDNTDIN